MLKFRIIYYIFSSALVLGSIVVLILFGLNLGIDFAGGALFEITITPKEAGNAIDIERWLETATEPKIGEARVQDTGTGFLIRLRALSEKELGDVIALIQNGAQVYAKTAGLKESVKITEQRFESVGPTIGKELQSKAFLQLALVLSGIMFYVAWAFRHVGKVRSQKGFAWKFATVAIIALIHDVSITIGVFAVLGKFFDVEIDSSFIAAILLVLGYSVNDTIVVFDRIRENLIRHRFENDLAIIVNKSVADTMVRSLNTSLTILLVLFALLFFGGGATFYFSLALTIGISVGTYSSIFLASPLLYDWERKK